MGKMREKKDVEACWDVLKNGILMYWRSDGAKRNEEWMKKEKKWERLKKNWKL